MSRVRSSSNKIFLCQHLYIINVWTELFKGDFRSHTTKIDQKPCLSGITQQPILLMPGGKNTAD